MRVIRSYSKSFKAADWVELGECRRCFLLKAEEVMLCTDKIPTIAARKLGFSSAGAKISETINKAVDLLETQKVVTVTNGSVSLA